MIRLSFFCFPPSPSSWMRATWLATPTPKWEGISIRGRYEIWPWMDCYYSLSPWVIGPMRHLSDCDSKKKLLCCALEKSKLEHHSSTQLNNSTGLPLQDSHGGEETIYVEAQSIPLWQQHNRMPKTVSSCSGCSCESSSYARKRRLMMIQIRARAWSNKGREEKKKAIPKWHWKPWLKQGTWWDPIEIKIDIKYRQFCFCNKSHQPFTFHLFRHREMPTHLIENKI